MVVSELMALVRAKLAVTGLHSISLPFWSPAAGNTSKKQLVEQ